jgi:phage baseplate assembly protein W
MSSDFLGVGWSFPVRPGGDGDIELAEHEESVRQSVWLILGTSPGDRVMRPDFGCGLDDLMFSVGGAHTAGTVAAAVRRGLTTWEPRLDLLDVLVAPDPAVAGTLLIQITYRVRATNNVFNLVYPFYLEQGGAR